MPVLPSRNSAEIPQLFLKEKFANSNHSTQVRLFHICFYIQSSPKRGTEPVEHSNSSNSSDPEASHHTSPTISASLTYSPADFDPLAPLILNELCAAWFERYHPWFPILHQPSLLEVLQTSTSLRDTRQFITFKAIAAVTILDWNQSDALTAEQRQQWSTTLRGQIVMDAMSELTLQSLQAVLILTVLEYGGGRFTECWNLVALCKRCVRERSSLSIQSTASYDLPKSI